jgi:two-component system chemotaxis response regulator CheY
MLTQPKVRVLIVDDSSSDRIIAHAMLTKLKFREVQQAEDGKIAESKMVTAAQIGDPFHLIVLDWNMPRSNGLKLLQMIRSDRMLKNTKVILMTATSDVAIVKDAIRSGVDDFIIKPLEFKVLKAKLETLFPEIVQAPE